MHRLYMIAKSTLLSMTVIAAISVVSFYGVKTYVAIKADFELYMSESECATKLVRLGIERRDIKTGNGTCYIGS